MSEVKRILGDIDLLLSSLKQEIEKQDRVAEESETLITMRYLHLKMQRLLHQVRKNEPAPPCLSQPPAQALLKSPIASRGFSTLRSKKAKNPDKLNRSQIKLEFAQNLRNIGAHASFLNGQNTDDVSWALNVLGAKANDHENELKALYRYLVKSSHPDSASASRSQDNAELFEKITKAWEILKENGRVK